MLKHKGDEVPMRTSWGSGSTSGTHEKKEIGRYEITTPDNYTLSVNGFNDDRVFSFGLSEVKGVLFAAFVCLLLNLFGWFGAPAIVAVVLVMRARRERARLIADGVTGKIDVTAVLNAGERAAAAGLPEDVGFAPPKVLDDETEEDEA